MAGKKMSPTGARRTGELEDLNIQVQRVNAMVEQYAVTKTNPETLAQPIKRQFQTLRMNFMGAGLDAVAQICGAMEIAAGRGGNQQTKVRIMRDAVASIKFQLELEQRSIIAEEDKLAHEKEEAKEAAKAAQKNPT